MVSFPFLLQDAGGIFKRHLLWETPGDKAHNIVVAHLWLGLPGVLRVVCTESPAIHQLQFKFSYHSNDSRGVFCFWVSAQVSWLSVFTCLSLVLGGSSIPCILPYSYEFKESYWFSFGSAFYLLWSISNFLTRGTRSSLYFDFTLCVL